MARGLLEAGCKICQDKLGTQNIWLRGSLFVEYTSTWLLKWGQRGCIQKESEGAQG